MSATTQFLSLSIPRALIREIPGLASDLLERMHALLERNTEGTLNVTERGELETLVHMAQFAQILALIAHDPPTR